MIRIARLKAEGLVHSADRRIPVAIDPLDPTLRHVSPREGRVQADGLVGERLCPSGDERRVRHEVMNEVERFDEGQASIPAGEGGIELDGALEQPARAGETFVRRRMERPAPH